ncbi:MAG: hypothetical protein ACFFDQ_04930 [Candidatus Thorarchaeota archaeon]
MSGELPSFAKYVFLLGFIVSLIMGGWSFLSPESWCAITEWPVEIVSVRTIGALLLTLSVAAILAFRAKTWKEVELYVLTIIVFSILGIIAMVWNIALPGLPLIGWLNTGLLVLFFVLYTYVYYRCK